ncbi:photosystem II biogenesis protein Psp29 [Pseudanabaena sp. PCC 6802]|uniref:photosystem II biogenesis protein Psp29 n=1 Tax=Pseudanabaena sp. PCC 6802 TaxID=118173 RepID=UPI00056D184E|nr:photosystem II biogenesis protein Psp29 [Pseudanabaena sp. PCC 6802]
MNTVRTVSDTKRDFHKAFPKPVNSVYRRVIDELLVEVHLLVVNQNFAYDPIFALGLTTAFDKFTAGYQPEADSQAIFTAMCQALLLDRDRLRQDAERLNELVMRSPGEVKNLLTTLESVVNLDPLTGQIRAIAANQKFKYSRLFAIGLYALLETAEPEAIAKNDRRQEILKQVGTTLNLGEDRLTKDIDLYCSTLEKVEQSRQMMADLVEAERKKREKLTAKTDPQSSENQDNSSTSENQESPLA